MSLHNGEGMYRIDDPVPCLNREGASCQCLSLRKIGTVGIYLCKQNWCRRYTLYVHKNTFGEREWRKEPQGGT